jgi:hypothetical protein
MNLLFSSLLILIASFPTSSFSEMTAWSMNDASVLLPLPDGNDFQYLLSPSEKNSTEALLPHSVFQLLPELSNQANQESLYWNNIKVIGVRFDPCFQEGESASYCRRQIRLVWQPLLVKGNQTTTIDAAIHTFHEFSESEWELIKNQWRPNSNDHLPLQINPTIQVQGYQGAYWNQLKKIILQFCHESNLIRVTTMGVRQNNVWNFMGIDRTPQGWKRMEIPKLNSNVAPVAQLFFLVPESLLNLKEFKGGASRLPQGQENWEWFLSDSINMKKNQSEAEFKKIIRKAIQLENPKLNNPGTSDCVSCHLAQPVRLWGEANFKNWNWDQEFKTDQFAASKQNLENKSVNPFQADRLRSFGYFGFEPIISQRVIHETAIVVDTTFKK